MLCVQPSKYYRMNSHPSLSSTVIDLDWARLRTTPFQPPQATTISASFACSNRQDQNDTRQRHPGTSGAPRIQTLRPGCTQWCSRGTSRQRAVPRYPTLALRGHRELLPHPSHPSGNPSTPEPTYVPWPPATETRSWTSETKMPHICTPCFECRWETPRATLICPAPSSWAGPWAPGGSCWSPRNLHVKALLVPGAVGHEANPSGQKHWFWGIS